MIEDIGDTEKGPFICEKCVKKHYESKKISSFKPPIVVRFEKEQRERTGLAQHKYIPQLVIEILMYFKFKNPTLYSMVLNNALDYEKRKEREQNLLQIENPNRQIVPRYVGKEDNGDGKIASGYRADWEKGITQIIQAFTSTSFTLS